MSCLPVMPIPVSYTHLSEAVLLDERFMATPGLAVDRSRALTKERADFCIAMFQDALSPIRNYDAKIARSVTETEEKLDMYERCV